MRSSKIMLAGAVAALALTGVSTAALAAHGKAGQWSVDTSISGQDVSKMPPQQVEAMRAHGMIPNSKGGFTVQTCKSAEEMADDSRMIDTKSNPNCMETSHSVTGHTATADLVCKGQVNGTAHVSVNYDSDTHYSGQMTIQGTGPDGSPMSQTQTYEGHWVSATCATPGK